MKTKDISIQYGLNLALFENFLKQSTGIPYKTGLMGGMSIDDDAYIDVAVNNFQKALLDKEYAVQQKEQAAQQKQQAMASMLITSGFNFDGYTITKYSGYISGDDVVQIERGTQGFFSSATNVGESLMNSLVSIRRRALTELKEAAYDLGCNAVVGVDFDYLTLDPQTANSAGGTIYLPYVFGVTANGNAVIIEKG
jgi:uncharacterized protein YbjQ (UPF0145 family)